jgi:RNA polymerase sigma-70 factor (ECF subfamily)
MSRTTSQSAISLDATSSVASSASLSQESALAAEIKALVVAGKHVVARERFSGLVALQQRRAARIAYRYLRDVHDADEAVQDAFVKVFTHIADYREELPFEIWFTRILVNGCLDLRKARSRRLRWMLPAVAGDETAPREPAASQADQENQLLASEHGRQIAAAVAQLPARQRTVFLSYQIAGQSAGEVGQVLGISESTVRVHLFRAIRKLRELLEHERRLMSHSHLSNDRLVDVCLDLAPAAAERQHLESCDLCEGRHAKLARLLADVSEVARAEADAVFSLKRLERQRDRILQRIEQEVPRGRVIDFPSGHGQSPAPLRTRPEGRWIVGAAAAGLVIGLLAGHLGHDLPAVDTSPASQAGPQMAGTTLRAVSTALSEEEFLGRLEVAIDGAGGSALRPLHDLTPLVWEVEAP